jgi:hypothetical protein
MDLELTGLSGPKCVALLRAVARHWIEQPNVEAFVTFQNVQASIRDHAETLPGWLNGETADPPAELVAASRAALQAIAEGQSEDAKEWLAAELAEIKQAKGEMIDPVTLSILGATLVGCILAARVKKIGSVQFYEGVPPELSKILKEASGVISR